VEIKRLLHRFRITAIYVTHDQTEAMALGDRVAVMHQGGIEQVGTFSDILNHPQNVFVAGFLGTPPMNLIEGTISDTHILLSDDQRIPLPDRLSALVHRDQQVTLGIPPGAAQFGSHPDQTAPSPATAAAALTDIILKGTITVIEPDFGRRQQTVYVDTGAFTYYAIAPLSISLTVGYDIAVGFPLSALHIFDTATGERVT
jgi:multiple sugar transport system ATP-binding protein